MRNPSKRPLDFIGYVQTLRVTNTRIGMFIEDARADLNLVNARSWKQLQEYFETNFSGMRDDVLPSARIVWRKFRARYPAYLEPITLLELEISS